MSQQVLELVTIHKNHRWTAGEPPTKNRRLLLSLSPERPERRSFTNIFRSPFKMWSLLLSSKSHSKSFHSYELTGKVLNLFLIEYLPFEINGIENRPRSPHLLFLVNDRNEISPKPDRNRNMNFLPNRNRTETETQYRNNIINIF